MKKYETAVCVANTDDLKEKDGYGELVGGKCGCLQKAFGLKFDTIEEAYPSLEDNDEEVDLVTTSCR